MQLHDSNPWDSDDDLSDDYDWLSDDDAELIDCPQCGAEIYEDSQRCPVCGDWIVPDTGSVWSGRPLWWIVLGAAGLLASLATLVIS